MTRLPGRNPRCSASVRKMFSVGSASIPTRSHTSQTTRFVSGGKSIPMSVQNALTASYRISAMLSTNGLFLNLPEATSSVRYSENLFLK